MAVEPPEGAGCRLFTAYVFTIVGGLIGLAILVAALTIPETRFERLLLLAVAYVALQVAWLQRATALLQQDSDQQRLQILVAIAGMIKDPNEAEGVIQEWKESTEFLAKAEKHRKWIFNLGCFFHTIALAVLSLALFFVFVE